ncbi:MAG: S9 family peptidase [Candidatus Rokubacteria bacterium]|nr:S9 family peptidase [Candidatus Rokubacteria bacterium]
MTRRPFEPHDITRIRWVSDARVSPDGRRVAFVMTTLDEPRDEYLSRVWVTGPDRPFTTGPKRDTAPRWSPDGRWLAFVSERDGPKKPQLYLIPAAGGEAVRLTDLPHGVADPVWSPDATRLAFVARVGGHPEPESEEDTRRSKPARVISTLKYRLNGEGFVYDRRPHVFVVSVDGGTPVQITEGDFVHEHPAWSPDAEWLAFTSARHDERDGDDVTDVWVAPAKGGAARRLTATAGPAALPAWSPDGRAIAYVGRGARNFFGGNLRLFTVPVAGGRPRCLTEALDRSVSLIARPHWLADGSILFATDDRGDVPLWRVAADGAAASRRVIGGERSITSFSVSRDRGTVAFTANDVTAPDEVFVARADGTDERRLTDVNAGWRTSVHVAPAERFVVERAGHAIDAWIMRPFPFAPGRRYPALVNVHGGPHAQSGHGFFDEFQVYAAAGYAVVFANPRGSQGYGEAFARAVVGDWGGGDFADVMAAVDETLRRFDFIDGDRLGLMGGSYGGFLTSWAVGHTTRFRAACSERAVNNQLTMFGTSDIGHVFQVVEGGGSLPWEDPARWVERSPLTYAKEIRTPLLIVHSEDDLRCPISEAEQLFVALKKLGRDVTLVRFPDETHELTRSGKPRHRLERFRIILDWFAKYLAPETR